MKNFRIVGVWSFYSEFSKKNFMLKNRNTNTGDDVFWGQNELYRIGKSSSIIFKTLDLIDDWSILDAILVFDYPKPIIYKNCEISSKIVNKILLFKIPSFLVLQECSVIKPNNWNISNHKNWKKIFTWNDDFNDNKYVNLRQHARIKPKNWWKREIPYKFSTLVASNKISYNPNEGHSERLKCIKWFNNNHPTKLDLYGQGWDQFRFSDRNRIFEKLNKMTPLMRAIGPKYKVWKGTLTSKRQIAYKYKFHFAYENAKNINGYITEKIIEAFLMCSVPIYHGAPNVTNHIEADCFINILNFKSYEDLYKFLSSMNDNEYLDYLDRIKSFIEGPKYYPFTSDYYAKKIISTINNETI